MFQNTRKGIRQTDAGIRSWKLNVKILAMISITVALGTMSLLAYDSQTLDKICQDSGGKRNGDMCMVPILTNTAREDSNTTDNSIQIKTMKPNSVEIFYYPDPSKETDTYKPFMLIRLPEWMGGSANDTSAFRAYSAKSLDDSCSVRYWPNEGRQRIENPCQGAMYRVIDGAMTYGAIHRSTALTALPHLDLSTDDNGKMYVNPPKFSTSENGVIGHGRNLSMEEIRSNSAFLSESFAKHHPDYPPIPVEFGGHILSEISPERHTVTVKYLNFPGKSGYFEITIGKLANGIVYPNFEKPNLEYWQIEDTIIRIGGSAMEESNNESKSFRMYNVDFSDGYNYRVTGKNLELIKKSIVMNFFPENEFEDLFLVSSTINK